MESVRRFGDDVRSLASEVHSAELASAVRRDDVNAVSQWGQQCAAHGSLDCRSVGNHFVGSAFALSASPLWYAVYRGEGALAEALLRHGADPDGKATTCVGGRKCKVGGRSAVHVAVLRCQHSVCGKLLALGALADAPMCFAVASADEPEWDDTSESWSGGLAGLSVLQLAAVRGQMELCTTLLAHGGDGSSLSKLPGLSTQSTVSQLALLKGKNVEPLRRCTTPHTCVLPSHICVLPSHTHLNVHFTGEDGEPLDCAICLSEIPQLTAAWTPCCCTAFHSHCLRKLKTCPMCRTPLPLVLTAPPAVAAEAAASSSDRPSADSGTYHEALLPFMTHHEQALEVAFSSPWWGDRNGTGQIGSYNSVMGTNFGWRTGGPDSTLYTV